MRDFGLCLIALCVVWLFALPADARVRDILAPSPCASGQCSTLSVPVAVEVAPAKAVEKTKVLENSVTKEAATTESPRAGRLRAWFFYRSRIR